MHPQGTKNHLFPHSTLILERSFQLTNSYGKYASCNNNNWHKKKKWHRSLEITVSNLQHHLQKYIRTYIHVLSVLCKRVDVNIFLKMTDLLVEWLMLILWCVYAAQSEHLTHNIAWKWRLVQKECALPAVPFQSSSYLRTYQALPAYV